MLRQSAITSFFKTTTNPSTESVKRKIDFVEDCKQASSKAQVVGRKKVLPKLEVNVNNFEMNDDVREYGSSTNNSRRCPFYKMVPGTSYVVDAFSYGYINGTTAYFLSHFHSDHYGGISRAFHRPIYCSKVTANLLKLKFRINNSLIRILPLDSATTLPCGNQVVALNSNHCPGAVMFLFKLLSGKYILHCGDMRADGELIANVKKWISAGEVEVYLDTTYLNPRYQFLPQNDVVDATVNCILDCAQGENILIACGTYTIGKEKVFSAIAKALNCKAAVSKEKQGILRCLEDQDLFQLLTLDYTETRLHVISMNQIDPISLRAYLKKYPRYNEVVGVCATGWEYRKPKKGETSPINIKRHKENVTILSIPYSEHSSFNELKEFVTSIVPKRLVPTVHNGSPSSRNKMSKHLKEWSPESLVSA